MPTAVKHYQALLQCVQLRRCCLWAVGSSNDNNNDFNSSIIESMKSYEGDARSGQIQKIIHCISTPFKFLHGKYQHPLPQLPHTKPNPCINNSLQLEKHTDMINHFEILCLKFSTEFE